MFKKGTPAAEFGVKVILPTVSAATVIAVLLYHVLNVLLGRIDAIEQRHVRQEARTLVTHLASSLDAIAQSSVLADDAFRSVYPRFDAEWVAENWGEITRYGSVRSLFLVTRTGETVAGFERGEAIQTQAASILSPGTMAYLAANAGADVPALLVNGIDLSSGVFRAYTAVAVPADPVGGQVVAQDRLYLLLTRVLDDESVRREAAPFGFTGAKLVPGAVSGEQSYPLTDTQLTQIGALQWSEGIKVGQEDNVYRQVIWPLLASLYFVIGMLVNMSWKGFRQASDVRAQAVASALRDDLTGLPNRRSIIDLLSSYLATPKLAHEGLSVIFADLDGFKEVNDSYGHEIGDLLLKSAAGGFEFIAQGRGTVARLGGDEFAVVVQGANAASTARDVAQNMLRFLAEPIVFGGRVASVSVSAGIVDRTDNDADADAEELLRRADAAMYAAKSAGRNRVQIYEPSLDSKREESRRIARELRTHIDAGQLGVVYQPIVDARTRQIAGVEALVRWPKTTGRSYGPDVFVPVAEEFGMIEDLGYFVMMQACRQAAQWPRITVSVNVSPIQFMNPSFAETVERILQKTGLEAQRLEVEVTEGFIIDNAERAAAIINKLHSMRVSVALDDFGTGYSSIGHLRRFRFDKLKLDRSMVSDILLQPSALRLVQGTIAMADALGLRVTAEGIEDENQVSVLRLAGCSQFQGYLFSRPVEAERISASLEKSSRSIAV